MTVLEIMERANSRDTKLVIAFIKDAVMRIQSTSEENLKVNKQDIDINTRDYALPTDLVSLKTVSILDTEDDNKYKRIPRLTNDPHVTEDTNP
tara:strand:- start:375 stop:653 length:279 start_codon:yes stop_codon:yes gene_type:complete